MKNQVKLFAANLVLAAAAFAVVGAAHADAQVPATHHSATTTVVKYLSMVGQDASQAYSPINRI